MSKLIELIEQAKKRQTMEHLFPDTLPSMSPQITHSDSINKAPSQEPVIQTVNTHHSLEVLLAELECVISNYLLDERLDKSELVDELELVEDLL